MKLKYILILSLILSVSLFTQTESLNNQPDERLWISLGLGVSDDQIDPWQPYPSSGFSFNYSYGNKLFRLRYYYNSLHAPFTEQMKCVEDIGFLYGYRKQFAKGAVSLSVGISLVNGFYYKWLGPESGETYDRISYSSVGFPFEAQLDWLPFRKFGLGMSIYCDLNSEMNYYGLMLSVNLGKVR